MHTSDTTPPVKPSATDHDAQLAEIMKRYTEHEQDIKDWADRYATVPA